MDMDISTQKSVDMDMDMDGKFHIHGKPAYTTRYSVLCLVTNAVNDGNNTVRKKEHVGLSGNTAVSAVFSE